tara:strand:- start:9678 stop:11300 length:1623 start_codon:yes stop_codon:yes gene_type:complete
MNGIASLPYEVQDAPMVPLEGVGKIKNATDLLAQFGREGDTYIVHAAEGETVLPLEVLNSNPKMKNMIYKQMEELGLDPERYIVGNKLNSINPVTGAPEFFFKRIFRSIKKLVKKVAPIVLPVAAPFLFPMMPVALAAGLGSFAGNLIGGTSIKDSFKKALFSAALAGVGNIAFGNMASGASNPFGSNFGQGFGSGSFFGSSVNPTAGFGDFSFSDAFTPSFSSNFAGASNAYRNRTMTDPNVALGTPTPNNQGGQIQETTGGGLTDFEKNRLQDIPIAGDEEQLIQLGKTDQPNIFEKYVYNPAPNTGVNVAPDGALLPQRQGEGYLESIFSPNRSSINPLSAENIATQGQNVKNYTDAIQQYGAETGASPELLQKMTDSAVFKGSEGLLTQPSTYTKYLPLAAAGTAVAGGGAYAAGMFDTPTPGPDNDGDGVPDYWTTGQDLWQRDPSKYGFGTDNFYGNNPYYQDSGFMPTVPVTVAGGGHISGAGTATSDSIPAMLSDGEFVMNAKAVRGAGGGDREKGARKMYAMMRSLENRMT